MPVCHRPTFARLCLGALLALIAARAASAQTVQALLPFEDRPTGTVIFNQYNGVTFTGGDASPPRVLLVEPPLGTISGKRAIQHQFRGLEFGAPSMEIRFLLRQARVRLSTGVAAPSPVPLVAVLRGYDDAGALVAASQPVALGIAVTPIDQPLEVADAQGRIRRVLLKFYGKDDPNEEGPVDAPVVIDNLEYAAPIAFPPPDVAAPVITIDEPGEGAALVSGAPGLLQATVRGKIAEAALRAVAVSVNGGPPFTTDYGPESGGGQYRFFAYLGGEVGLHDGANQLTITATDFAGNTARASRSFTYTVQPLPPPSTVDIAPTAIQVTQSIDPGPTLLHTAISGIEPTVDGFRVRFPSGVSLVQGKPTLLRLYGSARGTQGAVAGVPALVEVYRDNCTSNCYLGITLPPMQGPTTPRWSGITVQPAGQPAATPAAQVGDLTQTWNFVLPPDLATQDLVLHIFLNNGRYGRDRQQDSVPECESNLIGECRNNNHVAVHLHFGQSRPVTFTPVRLRFHGRLGDKDVDATYPQSDIPRVLRALNQVYPSRFALGPVQVMEVDPAITDTDLLNAVVNRFRPARVAPCPSGLCTVTYDPAEFVVALVPDAPAGLQWRLKNGGVAYLGRGAVWARPGDPLTVAHEMGHAIGFKHATCLHGEDKGGSCDPYFPYGGGEIGPYSHGSIGGPGFDFANWRVLTPVLAGTDHFHDFMSYGRPRWVSAYTWRLTQDRAFVGSLHYNTCWDRFPPYPCGVDRDSQPQADAADGPAILISGTVSASGAATLLDAYELPAAADLPSGTAGADPGVYRLRGVDDRGNTILFHDFAAAPLSHPDGEAVMEVRALVPVRGRLARVELTDGQRVLASLLPRGAAAPGVQVRAPAGTWRRDEVRRVEWTVDGAERFSARVEYLPGDGGPGRVLGQHLTGGHLDVPVRDLPGGAGARLIVRVSNGISTTAAASAPFDVEAAAPTVMILEPAAELTVEQGTPVTLLGTGADDRAALPDEALSWSSSRDGALGGGAARTVTGLTVGVHEILLAGTGRGGLGSTASVRVTVTGPAGPDPSGGGCDGCAVGGRGPAGASLPGAAVLLLLLLLRRGRATNRARGQSGGQSGGGDSLRCQTAAAAGPCAQFMR